MTEFKNQKEKTTWFACLGWGLLFFLNTLFLFPVNGLCRAGQLPVIVIDPGHGGHDGGAKGPGGTNEKDIVLALAGRITDCLAGRYRVKLTRTDDYSLPLPERTSFANAHKAALFISIHTSGSYTYKTNGITLICHAAPNPTGTSPSGRDLQPAREGYLKHPWDTIQTRHMARSIEAARKIADRLSGPDRSTVPGLIKAPVYVLAGADMPALLIEIGYLTNPLEEKQLKNNESRKKLAESICMGIDDFFMHAAGQESASLPSE